MFASLGERGSDGHVLIYPQALEPVQQDPNLERPTPANSRLSMMLAVIAETIMACRHHLRTAWLSDSEIIAHSLSVRRARVRGGVNQCEGDVAAGAASGALERTWS